MIDVIASKRKEEKLVRLPLINCLIFILVKA